MSLKKHIGHGETIQLKFGIGEVYLVLMFLFWSLIFGGIIYFFRNNSFLFIPPLIAWGLLCIYLLTIYFTTHYFVTEKKIYRKTGVFWKKIIDAKKDQISDISVVQGFLDRYFFYTGTIKINTAGGPSIEIILEKVQRPYFIRKEISRIWHS